MTRTCLLILAAALFPALLAQGAGELTEFTAAGVWKNIDPKDRTAPPPFDQARLVLAFTDKVPEGLKAAPEGVESPMYASPAIGGKTTLLAIAKDKADAPAATCSLRPERRRRLRRGRALRAECPDAARDDAGQPHRRARGRPRRTLPPARLRVRGRTSQPLTGVLFGLFYFEATVKVGEKEYTARFRDDDFDGRISGEKDGWTLAPAGPVTEPVREFGLCGLTEGIFLGGQIFRPSAAEDLSVKLSALAAAGPDAADLAAHRERVEKVWFARFDVEKASFVAQAGVDTKRPLAETPIDWKYVSFAEAQKLAKESGKPLFVDVLAFWCVCATGWTITPIRTRRSPTS